MMFARLSVSCRYTNNNRAFLPFTPGFLSLRKEEPLPELFPQTPVSGYSWLCRTQVAFVVS